MNLRCDEEEDDTDEPNGRVPLDDDGNPLPESERPRAGNGKKNKKYKSVFMEGVPGVIPFHQEPQLTQLQNMVQRMCNWKK
jgi:hypothetical protein